MRKITLFLATLSFIAAVEVQNDTVKTNVDLPVINYETASLQKGDTIAINIWIKNLAASESKHTDSILKNCVILIQEYGSALRTKSLCNFITGNWNDLLYEDKVFAHMRIAPSAYKKGGIAELSCYAKAVRQPGNDINDTYRKIFKGAMDSLTVEEQEVFIGNILSNESLNETIRN